MGVAGFSPGTSARDCPHSLDSSRKIKSQFWFWFHQRNDSCSTERYATPCSAEVFQDSGTKTAKDHSEITFKITLFHRTITGPIRKPQSIFSRRSKRRQAARWQHLELPFFGIDAGHGIRSQAQPDCSVAPWTSRADFHTPPQSFL